MSFPVLQTNFCNVCVFVSVSQGTQIELSIGVILGISTMAGKGISWSQCNFVSSKKYLDI